MRELGKGQSVVFCVPDEIRMKIRSRTGDRNSSSDIEVSDILEWAISETWRDANRSMPIWAMQGKRHQYHETLWNQGHVRGQIEMTRDIASQFLEDDAQSLEGKYRPSREDVRLNLGRDERNDDPIIRRCRDFGFLDYRPATLREEQERELAPEIEQQRQVQRPPPAAPLAHKVHSDILQFVSTGVLPERSLAYMPALASLADTSAAAYLTMRPWSGSLMVSMDFVRSVAVEAEISLGYISDSFQRSVQWILTGGHRSPSDSIRHMIIISPYEAQQLLPSIKESPSVALHLYAPRPNLGYRPLDSLQLHTVPDRTMSKIPQSLIIELNLFSGQLYFQSFQEYLSVCHFLKIDRSELKEERHNSSDEFSGNSYAESRFVECPLKFFRVLLTKIRRSCENIDKTHMGSILDERLLSPKEFENAG